MFTYLPISWGLGSRQYLFEDNSVLNKFDERTVSNASVKGTSGCGERRWNHDREGDGCVTISVFIVHDRRGIDGQIKQARKNRTERQFYLFAL